MPNRPTVRKQKQVRLSSAKRGYGRDWRRSRLIKLSECPLCYDCGKPAQEVHHIHKIKHRPDLRLSADNLLSLCSPCHLKRTLAGE